MRAVGPGLQAFGVSDALAAPVVDVFRNGISAAHNQGWSLGTPAETAALVTAMTRVNAFALATGSSDAAMVVTVEPGDYTLRVTAAPEEEPGSCSLQFTTFRTDPAGRQGWGGGPVEAPAGYGVKSSGNRPGPLRRAHAVES